MSRQDPRQSLIALRSLLQVSEKDAADREAAQRELKLKGELLPHVERSTGGSTLATEAMLASLVKNQLAGGGAFSVPMSQMRPDLGSEVPWGPSGFPVHLTGDRRVGTCWLCQQDVQDTQPYQVGQLGQYAHSACLRAQNRRGDAPERNEYDGGDEDE